ncbi:universal stress protein [Isachenkonia alkalipeptolytica]|uniref:Universal stress protein n=1 Tax=Isachenkonia alkalipeptolytica TaxID=2565777 RepID=A0AA43XI01_9CLOT|nr:universal stress protein [Isachenkonia alkalipeptolytica]NBG87183.1 universal stress protein [Isachenkonia alkalipeptolytica]
MLFDKVLLATDYSPAAETLFQCLPELKNFGLKEVILTHVADTHSAGGNVVEFQKHNERKLEAYKKELEELGLSVTVKVPIGFIGEEINRIADEEKVSLILTGSRGKGIIQRRLLGSSTTDILRKAATPVLVEKCKKTGPNQCEALCKQKFLKILIPTDFSIHADKMVNKIKEIKNLQEVVLLSVIEKGETAEEVAEKKNDLKDKLSTMQKEFEDINFTATTEVREGKASDNILEIAAKENITLIAIPKKGAGDMKELLIGSTADAVVRKSKVPVLVFPEENS